MRHPFRTLRNFIADSADRVRDATRNTLDRLDVPGLRDGQNREYQPEHPHPVDRDASVAFGRDHETTESTGPPSHQTDAESAEHESEESYIRSKPSEAERHGSTKTSDATDDPLEETQQGTDGAASKTTEAGEPSQHQHQQEESGEAIGVLFDRQPRSIRTLQPVDEGEDRHRQTRHVFVSTGEWNGDQQQRNSQADVKLDVSKLHLDELELEVEDLDAQVALQASIAELVDINVGASVQLGEVELDIKGVEAEALLEVQLDEVRNILGRALNTLEEHPELITQTLETAEETTEQIGDVGEQAAGELGDVGEQIAEEATEAAGEAGETAGKITEQTEAADDLRSHADDSSGDDVPKPSIEAESRTEYEPNEET